MKYYRLIDDIRQETHEFNNKSTAESHAKLITEYYGASFSLVNKGYHVGINCRYKWIDEYTVIIEEVKHEK